MVLLGKTHKKMNTHECFIQQHLLVHTVGTKNIEADAQERKKELADMFT